MYFRHNQRKNTVDQYEESRRKRIKKRFSLAPTSDEAQKLLFSAKLSEVAASGENIRVVAGPGKVDNSTMKVHYSNRVMRKIFAKQILNKEHMVKVH